ncbi:MAG: glucuronate isomerase [Saprospiraceae bacterium]|nr:glucuronate isomerase [Saprospiraceae bacterium]
MKPFLNEHFLLETETAQQLYHEFARDLPIIDYHCHLPPDQIAGDLRFSNLTKIWLDGDHYKWRAMRTLGIDEKYITGNAGDYEKFEQWAACVPYTMRNPLYHWTHLELKRYFGIDELLSAGTAKDIFERASASLQSPEYSVRSLLRKMNVEIVCTTDDPSDDLPYHDQIAGDQFEIPVLPAFRPDKCLFIDKGHHFIAYIEKLGAAAGVSIKNLTDLFDALKKRMDYFGSKGCKLSDHGLEYIHATPFTHEEADNILQKGLNGDTPDEKEIDLYKSAVLHFLGTQYHQRGWTQQFHLGALRNTNVRMEKKLGPDTGFDSIGDWSQASALARFLNKLDETDQLTKTILYNLNPNDNAILATMIGNFNDGSTRGKIQFGSGWWYLDQKLGMEDQMNTLSNMGLLSCFVGMLTDSRSFLSFPRHEYFRRILCNLFGKDIEQGELPPDIEWIGKIIGDICYHNAKEYFQFGK